MTEKRATNQRSHLNAENTHTNSDSTSQQIQDSAEIDLQDESRTGQKVELQEGNKQIDQTALPPDFYACMPTDATVDQAELLKVLNTVDSDAGRKRVAHYLQTRPHPHYVSVPGDNDHWLQINADGRRVLGRIEGRTFRPVES